METSRKSDYISNPFIVAKQSLILFWQLSQKSLWQVVATQFAIFIGVAILVFITMAAGLVLLFTFIGDASSGEELATFLAQNASESLDVANLLAYAQPVAAALTIAGTAILMIIAAFVYALQISLVGKAVATQSSVEFNWVLKNALRRMWPLLAQMLLITFGVGILVLIPIFVFTVLISLDPGLLLAAALYYLAIVAGIFYIVGRLAFASFDVVVANLGPWQSIKNSWAMTKGRVVEVLGVLAIAFAGATVVTGLVSLLNMAFVNLNLTALTLLSVLAMFLASVFVSLAALSPIAFRYRQLQSYTKGSSDHVVDWPSNLGAITIAIVASMIISSFQALLTPNYEVETTIPQDQNQDIHLYDGTEPPATPDIHDIYNNLNVDPNTPVSKEFLD